jgi:hypothetical protein
MSRHDKALKALSFLPWVAGFVFSLPLVGYALWLYLHAAPLSAFPGEGAFFTSKQLELAFETAKTLLPMCAGYLVFAAPALKYLRDSQHLNRPIVAFGVTAVFSLGIVSVGLWTGVFAYIGDTANVAGREDHTLTMDFAQLNYEYSRALLCAKMAHLLFFASVVWFAATALDIMFLSKPDSQLTNDA